ncbi:hypothetical protein SK128_001760 [Halocaridina rubra]|uniref:C2 domain-containing protein n=1 Tax=Halocaridina rubra TaxID=373956 RepID=A0AAN9A174_HALRR
MSEESVEAYTLISREGLPGTLEGNGSHGCIELTTAYQAPSTLLVVVHKVKNLPHKSGRVPNPYVKLYLLSTGLKELKEESTHVVENTDNPEYETTFAFPLTKPLSEYILRVCAKTKHKRPHYLGQVVLCFAPFKSGKKVRERAWYDLADPKKDYVICFVGYKDNVKGISLSNDRTDDVESSSESESEEDTV